MAELINITNQSPADADEVMFNFRELEDRIGSGSGGVDLTELLGSGRFVGADWSVGAPEPGDGLAVVLPEGSKWLIEGKIITIENPIGVILGDVPSEAETVGRLYFDGDPIEDNIAVDWTNTANPAHPRLGKVISDAFGVESISLDDADLIFSQPAIRSLFNRVTLLEGGSGGGGSSYVGLAPWLPDPGDDRAAATVILELISALRSELMALIEGGGARPMQTSLDHLMHELAIVRQIAGKDQRNELERSQSANIIKTDDGEIYGIGTNDNPDHLGATNMTMNSDGTFEP